MYPDDKRDSHHFNPIDVPILNILAMEADQEYGWKYPSTETFQAFWGLGDRVLDNCIVKEIILNGDQSEQEQRDIIAWHHEKMAEDNDVLPYSSLSLDVEQVRCTLKDVLRLGGQQSYKKSSVTLSDRPGDEHFGTHKDPYNHLSVRVMWGNGVSWAVMLTILSDPQRTGHKTSHNVKKFDVPEYVVDLLRGLPLVTGFGIRGDILAIEDTFSLLTGQPVKLSGFIELGSLMLLAGWAMPTCNMPACHALMTGSIQNKQVSRADDRWGQTWSQILDSLTLHFDIPTPDAILYLTRVNQKEFVAEFNALL